MSLYTEIFEQPARLASLLLERARIEAIAARIRQSAPQYVFLAARGTSDNAGRYANYLWGAQNAIPVALAAPSLFTYYHQPPRLEGALVVGISQSGKSPDIISVLDEGSRQGCMTLAVTNAPTSPLAQAADLVLDIMAGEEKAVAATKTYTSELMALAMLSAALRNDTAMWSDLEHLPIWVEVVLKQDDTIANLAQRYRYMQQCVVLGRGYNYATAFEWALKLKELTYINAEPYSSADFQHGPIAMVAGGYPILAVVVNGGVFDPVHEILSRLRKEHLAELVVISDSSSALELAQSAIPLPAGIPEWLTPLASIVPAQLFACHLTRVKGFDTEKPRSITKITETH
jgi:glutamine---fructose-6-phosphate transaminase (isomerizing)